MSQYRFFKSVWAGLLVLFLATAAVAQTRDFNVPAGDLGPALDAYIQQSGVQLIYRVDDVRGLKTAGVQGALSVDAALDQLLADSGLTVTRDASGAMAVAVPSVEGAADPGLGGAAADDDGAAVDPSLMEPGVNTTGEPTTANVEVSRQGGIEEIIVTGQKREERIQDVPIAISAFNMEDLDNQKLEGGFDLLKAIPNVTFSKTNFSGYNFSIRGIGTQAVSATTDPGVAVSFNNTTLIVNRLFEQEYLDVERVEVLRGPQGTLYGRNATAGVINVISAKPKLGVTESEFKYELGNYNAARLRGMINQPLGDDMALRAAYASTRRDGYGYNEFDGSDVDGRDLWTGRLSLGWQPLDMLRFNLIYEHFDENDNRVRTSKQLCHRDKGAQLPRDNGELVDTSSFFFGGLSQACKPGSLYADEAFGTPNGASLPYVSALYFAPDIAAAFLGQAGGAQFAYGLGGNPWHTSQWIDSNTPPADLPCMDIATGTGIGGGTLMFPIDICNPDIYRGRMQSRDLRSIHSAIKPIYRASSDIYELSFDLDLTQDLVFSSQSVYAKDDYFASQDYNRFAAFPIWSDSTKACGLTPNPFFPSLPPTIDCSPDAIGTYADGFYANLTPGGILCDPQLGCSDTLLVQDLSRAESTQYNQEFRLVSDFEGPLNFSAGVNFTRFETQNDYFVFANGLTHLLNFWPFQYHARTSCHEDGIFCRYIDPNPLESINGEGHNYFRSSNPYKLTSSALFGETYWNATENVKITAGLRFTWDRKVFTPVPSQLLLADYRQIAEGGGFGSPLPPGAGPEQCRIGNNPVDCPLVGTAPNGRGVIAEPDIVQEWREPTGRLVVDWKPELAFTDETLLYASYSRGYKGGGANPPSVAAPAKFVFDQASGGTPDTFKAEYVNAFEIGAKNTLFGGGLILNGSAFYYDYKDYQVSKITDRRAANENFDAVIWGLELESILAPTPDLLINMVVGYLNTRIADGEESIDLMDRADGGSRRHVPPAGAETDFPDGFDEWIVIQPWISAAANCVVPKEIMAANVLGGPSGDTFSYVSAFCPTGNPAGGRGTVGVPMPDGQGGWVTRTYRMATDAPNGGAGFSKDLSGNELPNAPRFTFALGGQYTFYLPAGVDLTTRMDFYWQDESWARVYNLEGYDQLKAWTNTNFSVWINKADWGLRVEAYVKNLFDETPITGAFLNSEDSGLTTNVFTLDPRLVGVSIIKRF